MGVKNRKRAWHHIAADRDGPRSARNLRPAAKLLFLAIADVCSDELGVLTMGERKLAQKVGQSRAWVRLHRSSLVKAGLVSPCGKWKPGQAISWQIFPEIYGAEAPEFEPSAWKPSRSSTARDPEEVFGSTGRNPGPVPDRAEARPTEPRPGSGTHNDRAVVLAIEPDEPLVRDEEKERRCELVSEGEGEKNVLAAFPNAETELEIPGRAQR